MLKFLDYIFLYNVKTIEYNIKTFLKLIKTIY